MIKKIFRFSLKREFEEVKKNGRLVSTPLFGVLICPLESGPKFGWIVSKKISTRAVDRNRVRRLLALGVRRTENEWKDKKIGMIFLAKKAMLGRKAEEVEREVKSVISKL